MPTLGLAAFHQIRRARHIAQAAMADACAVGERLDEELVSIAREAQRTVAAEDPQAVQAGGRDERIQLWRDLTEAVEQTVSRRRQLASRLTSELAACDRQRVAAEQELETITATLDEQRHRQQRSAEALAGQLAEDPAFREGAQQAAQVEAALERAEAALAEVEYDAMQKLPAFEQSRLFKHLYSRRLGTPRYTAGKIHQRIDAWISRLINYPQAKADYDFLKTTPERMRALVAAHRDALAPLMRELERCRDQRADTLGLPQLASNVQATEQVRGTVVAGLEQLRRSEEATRRQWAEIESASGADYRRAYGLVRDGLERTVRRLRDAPLEPAADGRSAACDAHGCSDRIASLQQLQSRLEQLQLRASERDEAIERDLRYLSELGYFHQRFCSAGFDSSQSEFEDCLDLARELEEVRLGNDSIDLAWQRMRRFQQFGSLGRQSPTAERPLISALVSAMALAASPPTQGFARRAAARWTAAHRGGWGPLGKTKRPQPVRFGARSS